MTSRQHSLSRNSGFIPLGGSNYTGEQGIPLTPVRSNISTGTRKRGMNAAGESSMETEPTMQEKTGSYTHAGRRRRLNDKSLGRSATGGTDNTARLNFMGRVYTKIVGFSVVTRYLVYVAPVALLLAVPLIVLPLTGNRNRILLGSKTTDGVTNDGPSLYKLFIWIMVAWCALWAGKIVAWLLPRVFMFFSGIVSVGTRKYAKVLENLTIPLSLFFWALASWLTFQNLMRDANNNGIRWVEILLTIQGALFACSAVLLGEKAIVQLIGVSYHQRSFANRIKDSKREVYLLGLLYDASRTLFPMYCHEFEDEDMVINDSIEMMLRGKKARSKGGAVTPMRLIGDVGRVGNKVTSVFGNLASEITGKNVFNPNSAHSIVLEALEKLGPSEALARRIWMSFVVEGKDSLCLDDFIEVLGPAYKREAEEAFMTIDGDGNGDISLDEMIRKVVDVGKERHAIAEGMKDIGQALKAFDKVLLFVVLLISVFIFLAFFQSSFVTVVATAGTALLSLSFIFAATTQEFLGSCIFLFVKHPYDVGDRVDINDIHLSVERISLLYTIFYRLDKMQLVQIPNIQLNNLWVDNISRSKAMLECVNIDVSYDTSFEDIELLRMEMERFVRLPENARDFQPDFTIGVGGVGNLDRLTLEIAILHKSNWHDSSVRSQRRSKFMCALALALKKVPILGPGGGGEALGGPTNPSYSVAVTDDWAAKSRADAATATDSGRMVPLQTRTNDADTVDAERQAAAEFNARPPVPEMGMGRWDTHDDRTLGSQDNAADRSQRDRDLESIRDSLVKRQSTRGRRRAGEGLPTLTTTQSNGDGSLQQTVSPRLETFDEEAQTGMPAGYYQRSASGAAGALSSGHLHGGDAPQRMHSTRSQMSQRSERSFRDGRGPSLGQH